MNVSRRSERCKSPESKYQRERGEGREEKGEKPRASWRGEQSPVGKHNVMPCTPRIGLCCVVRCWGRAANQEPPSDLGIVSLTPPRGLACAIFPSGCNVSNRASNAPSFALRTAYQPQFSPLFLRGRITDLRAGTHRDGPRSGDGVHGDIRPRPGPSTCRVVAFYGRPRWLRSGMARPKFPKPLRGRSSFILAFISLHLALGSRSQRDNEGGRYLADAKAGELSVLVCRT